MAKPAGAINMKDPVHFVGVGVAVILGVIAALMVLVLVDGLISML